MTRLEKMPWLLNPDAYVSDEVPFYVGRTCWVRYPGEGWGADLTVKFDRPDDLVEAQVELVIRVEAGAFIAQVACFRDPSLSMSATFSTFHAAQIAAETHAIKVVHRVPEAAPAHF